MKNTLNSCSSQENPRARTFLKELLRTLQDLAMPQFSLLWGHHPSTEIIKVTVSMDAPLSVLFWNTDVPKVRTEGTSEF